MNFTSERDNVDILLELVNKIKNISTQKFKKEINKMLCIF